MNEPKEKLRFDCDSIKKDKKPSKLKSILNNKALNLIILGGALFGTVFFIGYQQGDKKPDPTPANSICRKFATEVPLYYKTQINTVFGEKPPTRSLTKEQLDALGADCDKNIQVYTFINTTETIPTTTVPATTAVK
jgi:hypothetical protein